jgi:hypothetical protein
MHKKIESVNTNYGIWKNFLEKIIFRMMLQIETETEAPASIFTNSLFQYRLWKYWLFCTGYSVII